eukprot:2525542-Lingulodinium_polyedra.AAC.1
MALRRDMGRDVELARFLHQTAYLHGAFLGTAPLRWQRARRAIAAATHSAGDPGEAPAPELEDE